MVTGFRFPSFEELLKRVKQPKVPTVKAPEESEEFDAEGASQFGYRIPTGWKLRRPKGLEPFPEGFKPLGDELISPRGLIFRNLKPGKDGEMVDFEAFDGDGKPVKFPEFRQPEVSAVSEKVTAPFAPREVSTEGGQSLDDILRRRWTEESISRMPIETKIAEAKLVLDLEKPQREVPLSRMPFERPIRTTAGPAEPSLAEQRRLFGTEGMTATERVLSSPELETAKNILSVVGAVGTTGFATYQGVQSLIPLTRQIADKTLQTALNTGIDRWIARMSRGVPPDRAKQVQNFLYDMLVKSRVWLQQRATENWLRRIGRTPNVPRETSAAQVVDDTINELMRLIPQGTQTGAMTFGGLPAKEVGPGYYPGGILPAERPPFVTTPIPYSVAQVDYINTLQALKKDAPRWAEVSLIRKNEIEQAIIEFEKQKAVPRDAFTYKRRSIEELEKAAEDVASGKMSIAETRSGFFIREEPKIPKAVTPGVTKPSVTKATQYSIDKVENALRTIEDLAPKEITRESATRRRQLASAYESIELHSKKLGIITPKLGTFYNPEEYLNNARQISKGVQQRYRSEAAIPKAEPVPAPVTPEVTKEITRIKQSIQDAVAEHPYRLEHAISGKTTGFTGFWITKQGKIYQHDLLKDIPISERQGLVNVHSHSPIGWEQRLREGKMDAFDPLGAGDIENLQTNVRNGWSDTMAVIMGDGRMEVLSIPDRSKIDFLRLTKTEIRKALSPTSTEGMRDALKMFAEKHGLEYQTNLSWKPETAIPTAEPGMPEAGIGRETVAYGPDPTKSYQMRYRLVELDDLIPSHTDAFVPNPAYPKELQPRIRERGAARLAVIKMAKDLVPEVLIKDDNTLDRGPMIIGADNVVESGNGRVMALRQAQQSYPERWQAYQRALQEALPQFGINQTQLSQMRNPVLVRERISDVDRVQFASEANQPVVAVFSPLENALQDSRRIRFDDLIVPEETISLDQTLRMAGNRPFVISFLETLPANERASLLDNAGDLNLLGMQRIKAAMFAATYPGESGRRLTQIFFESREPIIRNIEEGMLASLPKVARAEELVRAGNRGIDLSIGEDLAKSLDMLAVLRQRKLSVAQYLAQRQMFERELTPFQERLLQHAETIARSPRKVREFLGDYADAVVASPHPQQATMIGGRRLTKEDIFNATVKRQEEGPLFAQPEGEIATIPPSPTREPRLVEKAPAIPEAKVESIPARPVKPEAPVVAEVPPEIPPPFEPPSEPPVIPPPAEPPSIIPPPPAEPARVSEPPEGRPRTLTDLNREAKGMRALSPEERAGVMDMAKPIAEDELLYKVRPFNEHGDILLQSDKRINKVLRSVPGIKQATEILYPAQMERDNPVALIGIKKRIFEEIETGRARLASLKWWYQAKQSFDFKKVKGKWRATNIALSPMAEPAKAYHATIHDLVEHPENYVFTEQQQKVLTAAQDMQNQILRDAQRVGVDAVELSGDYWRRIVTKAPKGVLFDGKIKSRITQKKGYTRQRAFDFVDDGAKLGFEYETQPLRALQNRLESGIRTISDQSARKEIAKLPGIVKPLERLESRYPQTLEGVKTARQARDIAKQTFLRTKTIENETALRQAEADYITSMRELYFKKIAAGQPNIGELKLPNGRIAPVELAEQISKWVELPEIRTARGEITSTALGVTQLLRATLTNLDLAAGFIQGQALFYRNNRAWWISQGNAILSIADDRMAYVEKNLDVIDEGMRMGAISIPTEFMFTSQGIASIPTRVPVVGPVMKAFNRAFEWFIIVGQTELYKVARSGVIRRATGANIKRGEALERQAIEALTSLGSAIRKEMGTESYAILGVRPTQHTIEQIVLFAARFFRALTGIQAQSFTGGEGGREARRAMGSLIAGGLALLIAAAWATERKLPNMTDPFAPGWMMFKIGGTYFTTFGPFYPYFRAQAKASIRLAQGEPVEAAKVVTRFLESKEGLPFRGIDMAAQFSMYGSYRTFEGKRLPATPLGITEAVLGEMAVPISIQEAITALPEGRYESVVGEVWGLVGRKARQRASTEAIAKLGQVDQEALDKALKDVTNPKKISEIRVKDWTYDIQSLRRDIASGTKYLLEQDIAKLEPIVGAYWQFAEQKDEYELLSTEEKKKYLKDNQDFVANRLFWGELTEIPDLSTANAVVAKAEDRNIPLNMIPAFQLTDKGKERIPSDRALWKLYFDYYALPGGSYLSFTQEQVDSGELPEKYRKEWETYKKLKTDKAKELYRKRHKEAAKGDWRDDFRRKNPEFDNWLQEEKGLKPLSKKATRRRAASLPTTVSRGFGAVSVSRGSVKYPKFKKPKISTAMRVTAPRAPGI